MADPTTGKLNRSRIFLLVFFGLALLISISTIIASFQTWGENDAAGVTAPAPERLQP